MNLIEINADEYVSLGKCSIHLDGLLYLNWAMINKFRLECGRDYFTLVMDGDKKDRNISMTVYPKFVKGVSTLMVMAPNFNYIRRYCFATLGSVSV